jgi:hypothetical protein
LGTFSFGRPLAFWRFRWLLGDSENRERNKQPKFHISKIVTVIDIANVLSADRQTAIVSNGSAE